MNDVDIHWEIVVEIFLLTTKNLNKEKENYNQFNTKKKNIYINKLLLFGQCKEKQY